MDYSFITANDRQLKRLRAIVARLTDEDLMLALARLTFWDEHLLFLRRKCKAHGVAPSAIDQDVTNSGNYFS